MGLAKKYLTHLYNGATDLNRRNILMFASRRRADRFLDLGCDDGEWTSQVAAAARAKKSEGVEVVAHRAALARTRDIQVTIGDLNNPITLPSESYDLIHANQVIEHVTDVDLFAAEIYRLLKSGGSFIVSTENGSSWHNVGAAILGWQVFSLTNLSSLRTGIGNPLALHRNETGHMKSWTHKTIFNYRGLLEFFEAHGFSNLEVKGAGYYPLPTFLGAIDPRHAHFITIGGSKP